MKLVKCGVPQGFILGPLLFLIYNSGLSNLCSCSNLILLLDDTHTYDTHTYLARLQEGWGCLFWMALTIQTRPSQRTHSPTEIKLCDGEAILTKHSIWSFFHILL